MIIIYSDGLLCALSKSSKKPVSIIYALRACVHAESNNFFSQDEFLQGLSYAHTGGEFSVFIANRIVDQNTFQYRFFHQPMISGSAFVEMAPIATKFSWPGRTTKP